MLITTDAFEARALQHEIDHCDGMLFLDRVVGAHAVYPRKVYLQPPDRRHARRPHRTPFVRRMTH